MFKFFKNVVVKIIFILLFVVIIASIFLCRDWYEKQIHKIKGVYYIYIGDKYFAKKELNNAVKFYIMGLKEYPEHSQARCNLANIYVSYEDYESAVEEYKTALKYKPNYISCRMDLAIILADTLSEYDEAIEEYKKVTKSERFLIKIPFIFDNSTPTKENKEYANYNMGLAHRWKTLFTPREKLYNNPHLIEAIKAYNKALIFNKKRYDTLYNLALTYHLVGNNKDAGLNYCKAIESNPYRYEAHLNLGILLDDLKYYDEAIEEFNKAGLLIDDGDYETNIYLNDLLNNSYKKNAVSKTAEDKALIYRYYIDESVKKENFIVKLFNKFKKEKTQKDKNNGKIEESINIFIKDGKPKFKKESESKFKNRMRNCESKKIFKEML